MVITAVLVLTACGANDLGSSTSTDGTEGGVAASSAPAQEGNTSLEAPQPPAEKWSAAGDLCDLITNERAAEILGMPVMQFTGAPSEDPRVIDECDYAYDDDKIYVVNVLVMLDGNEVVEMAEKMVDANEFEIIEYQVDGFERAFYVNSEANALAGDMLVAVNNGATGKFDPVKLVEFATLVHRTASNR